MSTDAFIPESYEAPSSGGGFTKLADGDNRFRILSSPFMMWLSWTDGKPSRVPYSQAKPAKGSGQKDSVKHAWGLIVWNYKEEQIEVFELDKQDIINGLVTHSRDADWGHPKKYDIVINKSGSGMDTEYKLVCKPHSEPTQEIVDAFLANPVDLNQLLVDGGNPFISATATAAAPATTAAPAATTAPPAQAPAATGDPVADAYVAGQPIPEGYQAVDGGGIKKKMPF